MAWALCVDLPDWALGQEKHLQQARPFAGLVRLKQSKPQNAHWRAPLEQQSLLSSQLSAPDLEEAHRVQTLRDALYKGCGPDLKLQNIPDVSWRPTRTFTLQR